jgi:hypothetical protein
MGYLIAGIAIIVFLEVLPLLLCVIGLVKIEKYQKKHPEKRTKKKYASYSWME